MEKNITAAIVQREGDNLFLVVKDDFMEVLGLHEGDRLLFERQDITLDDDQAVFKDATLILVRKVRNDL